MFTFEPVSPSPFPFSLFTHSLNQPGKLLVYIFSFSYSLFSPSPPPLKEGLLRLRLAATFLESQNYMYTAFSCPSWVAANKNNLRRPGAKIYNFAPASFWPKSFGLGTALPNDFIINLFKRLTDIITLRRSTAV